MQNTANKQPYPTIYTTQPIVLMNANFTYIEKYSSKEKTIIFTDSTIFQLYSSLFNGYKVLQIEAGETSKTQHQINIAIAQMLAWDVDKTYLLVGVGGGVVTDMAGYLASIYKRGIKLGLVPTTILGMTDAAIGGKNGVNVGLYKNMVGTIYRPTFVLYDFSFLHSLPRLQWINGFAEIIKHASIKDALLFDTLASHSIDYYRQHDAALMALIEKNVAIKTDIVLADEFEQADRYLLNFGHTFGHAIENKYGLMHGHAISIGMVIAANLSQQLNGFSAVENAKLIQLLQQYELPISLPHLQINEVLALMQKDKKREGEHINFVWLNKIGNAVAKKVPFSQLAQAQLPV